MEQIIRIRMRRIEKDAKDALPVILRYQMYQFYQKYALVQKQFKHTRMCRIKKID